MTKTKDYKKFSFPNKLSPLEQYFYYLLEFDVIPKKISPKVIEQMFIAVSNDYLENLLDTPTYELIVENLYFNYVIGQVGTKRVIESLMQEISEHEQINEEKLRDKLRNIIETY